MDYKLDESYTPKKLLIRIGTCTHDLHDLVTIDINEPVGWVNVPLKSNNNTNTNNSDNNSDNDNNNIDYIKTFFIQIRFLAMHQNGRDAHIRSIKLYSPRKGMNAHNNSNISNNVNNISNNSDNNSGSSSNSNSSTKKNILKFDNIAMNSLNIR